MSTQTCRPKWGSLLFFESENQASRILFESLLLLFIYLKLGFYNSVQDSALKKVNLNSHNTQNQVFILKSKVIQLSTILQLAIVALLASAGTITSLNFSKYPDYVHSAFINKSGIDRSGHIIKILNM